MHIRLRLASVALVACALLLVACNDSEGADSTPTSTLTATTTESPIVAPTLPVTGGSSGGGTASGGIEPATPDAPPTGTLVSGSGEVELGLGTYCWSPPASSGRPGMCADYIGIITAPTALPVSAGETLTVTGDLPWPPLTIAYAVLRPAPDAPIQGDSQSRAWAPEGDGRELATDSSTIEAYTITLPEDLGPGRYLLAVNFTAGPDRGSEATYGAILDVR